MAFKCPSLVKAFISSVALWSFKSTSTQRRWRFLEKFPLPLTTDPTVPTREASSWMQSELQARQRCCAPPRDARVSLTTTCRISRLNSNTEIGIFPTRRAANAPRWEPPPRPPAPGHCPRGPGSDSLRDQRTFPLLAELQQREVLGCHSNALMIKENRCVV